MKEIYKFGIYVINLIWMLTINHYYGFNLTVLLALALIIAEIEGNNRFKN